MTRSSRGSPPQTLDRASEENRSVSSPDLVKHHPVVVAHHISGAADIQLRIADAITKFAGSMPFVYLHAMIFVGWMLFVETSPWPSLTLVVSPEAIFLSTFVMIGQNRQVLPAGQSRPRLRRIGTGAQVQHRPHPGHPHHDHRTPQPPAGRIRTPVVLRHPGRHARHSTEAVVEPSATPRATSDSRRL